MKMYFRRGFTYFRERSSNWRHRDFRGSDRHELHSRKYFMRVNPHEISISVAPIPCVPLRESRPSWNIFVAVFAIFVRVLGPHEISVLW